MYSKGTGVGSTIMGYYVLNGEWVEAKWTTANQYIRLKKAFRRIGIGYVDWGIDRVYVSAKRVYTIMFRDTPNSNANDVMHISIKDVAN